MFTVYLLSFKLTINRHRLPTAPATSLFKNHALTTGDAGKIPADVLVLGGLPKHPAVGSLTDQDDRFALVIGKGVGDVEFANLRDLGVHALVVVVHRDDVVAAGSRPIR